MRLGDFAFNHLLQRGRVFADRLRGLDFETVLHSAEVGLDPATAYRSSPSGNRFLRKVLRALQITSDDRLLDIGCGKGSALRTMLEFPFARVDGIELAPAIVEIARRNFQRLRAPRTTIQCENATTFEGYDPYNVIYFYNPFPAQVMWPVLDALSRSLACRNREMVLVYKKPECHRTILEQGTFTCHGCFRNAAGSGMVVYSNRSSADSRLRQVCSPLLTAFDGDV